MIRMVTAQYTRQYNDLVRLTDEFVDLVEQRIHNNSTTQIFVLFVVVEARNNNALTATIHTVYSLRNSFHCSSIATIQLWIMKKSTNNTIL